MLARKSVDFCAASWGLTPILVASRSLPRPYNSPYAIAFAWFLCSIVTCTHMCAKSRNTMLSCMHHTSNGCRIRKRCPYRRGGHVKIDLKKLYINETVGKVTFSVSHFHMQSASSSCSY